MVISGPRVFSVIDWPVKKGKQAAQISRVQKKLTLQPSRCSNFSIFFSPAQLWLRSKVSLSLRKTKSCTGWSFFFFFFFKLLNQTEKWNKIRFWGMQMYYITFMFNPNKKWKPISRRVWCLERCLNSVKASLKSRCSVGTKNQCRVHTFRRQCLFTLATKYVLYLIIDMSSRTTKMGTRRGSECCIKVCVQCENCFVYIPSNTA